MSFQNSGLNGDFPTKADLIGTNVFHAPHSPVLGGLVQGHVLRKPGDWKRGDSPKPSDMRITSAVPPIRSFAQCSLPLRIFMLEERRSRLGPHGSNS